MTGGFSRVASGPRLSAKPRPFMNLPPVAVSRAEGLIIHVTSIPHHKESVTATACRIFRINVPYEHYPAPVTVNYWSSSVINCLFDRWDLSITSVLPILFILLILYLHYYTVYITINVQIIFARLGYKKSKTLNT